MNLKKILLALSSVLTLTMPSLSLVACKQPLSLESEEFLPENKRFLDLNLLASTFNFKYDSKTTHIITLGMIEDEVYQLVKQLDYDLDITFADLQIDVFNAHNIQQYDQIILTPGSRLSIKVKPAVFYQNSLLISGQKTIVMTFTDTFVKPVDKKVELNLSDLNYRTGEFNFVRSSDEAINNSNFSSALNKAIDDTVFKAVKTKYPSVNLDDLFIKLDCIITDKDASGNATNFLDITISIHLSDKGKTQFKLATIPTSTIRMKNLNEKPLIKSENLLEPKRIILSDLAFSDHNQIFVTTDANYDTSKENLITTINEAILTRINESDLDPKITLQDLDIKLTKDNDTLKTVLNLRKTIKIQLEMKIAPTSAKKFRLVQGTPFPSTLWNLTISANLKTNIL